MSDGWDFHFQQCKLFLTTSTKSGPARIANGGSISGFCIPRRPEMKRIMNQRVRQQLEKRDDAADDLGPG
jgi:hypothetical protein